jgi:hypothetical protein
MELHILNDRETFPLLVRDPEAANLYQIGKTKSEKFKMSAFHWAEVSKQTVAITDSKEPTKLTNSSLSELVFFRRKTLKDPKDEGANDQAVIE